LECTYGEETAINGKWVKGPGKSLFTALKKALGNNLPIIAEDLGEITKAVDKLRLGQNLPGMRVLHFAFDGTGESNHLPHNFESSLTVAYTGTHDNNTTRGWYNEATDIEKDYLRRYMNISGEDVAWDLIRLCMSSNAAFSIVPVQDIMNLPAQDRMNTPGDASGWWGFRYTSNMLTAAQAERLKYLTELFARYVNC